ncbi:MAG: hypothetical protein ABIA04_12075 [Pseudomonadota bacterium]
MLNKTILFSLIFIFSIIGLVIIYFYYESKNAYEDPRVFEARKLLSEYDKLINNKDYNLGFALLQKLEEIYLQYPSYSESYEIGIIYNNFASANLMLAIYEQKSEEEKSEYLQKAHDFALKSIAIYVKWLKTYGEVAKNDIYNLIKGDFQPNDEAFKGKDIEKFRNKRIEEIEIAQVETYRRLSVSYTNLGMIQRHLLRHNDAIKSYSTALDLWEDNHTAKNNLRVLVGEEPIKRSIVDKLFPKDRKTK